MQKDNATGVLTRFVSELKAPITRTSVSEELQKHPDYYSMLAFADVLQTFGIESGVYEVPYQDLGEVPLPFICLTTEENYVVVTDYKNDTVVLSNEVRRNKKLNAETFKALYRGKILIAEDHAQAGEVNFDQKNKQEKIANLRLPIAVAGLTIVLGALLVRSINYPFFNISITLLLLFKSVGLATCVLLLIQSIDANNPLVQRLCGGDNDKNCNAILSSNAAKIGGLSWSEIGFFYFSGTWLALLFNSGNQAILGTLAILNIISLPYTFYSIYYQWRIARQWCVFCCTIQGLLWLEFLAFIPHLSGIAALKLPDLEALFTGLTLPVFLWMLVKPYFLQINELLPLKDQLRHFKYNKELFESALKSQPKYSIPDAEWSIVLGNPDAENVVVMISNPYCPPCEKAHMQIEDALNNTNDMQVRVVFVGRNTNEKDERTKVHRHLMALNALKDKTVVRRALHDWYAQKKKNYEHWAKAYPATIGPDVIEKLEKQRAWTNLVGITGTPTLLLNGHQLPRVYQLRELKYMLYA